MEAAETESGAWIENWAVSGGGKCGERESERVHNSNLGGGRRIERGFGGFEFECVGKSV